MAWNRLPLDVKMAESYEKFQLKLKEHIWISLKEKQDYEQEWANSSFV